MDNIEKKDKCTIIPIASGKGGVGKTFLTANLAISLANRGFSTIAVDMDLGSPNLHSYLGLSNNNPGIGDFLAGKEQTFEDLILNTKIPNLQFVAGDGITPFLANIKYHQKKKLLKSICKLKADYVLLDLGAGSSFNVLDFFSITDKGILVTIPEFPSIFSVMGFLKNSLFRMIKQEFRNNSTAIRILEEIFKESIATGNISVDLIIEKLRVHIPESEEKIRSICDRLRPVVVFNQAESIDEFSICKQLNRGLNKVLNLEAQYYGYIFSDPVVRQSVQKHKPFKAYSEGSPASVDIERVAERVIRYWGKDIKKSDQLLLRSIQPQ